MFLIYPYISIFFHKRGGKKPKDWTDVTRRVYSDHDCLCVPLTAIWFGDLFVFMPCHFHVGFLPHPHGTQWWRVIIFFIRRKSSPWIAPYLQFSFISAIFPASLWGLSPLSLCRSVLSVYLPAAPSHVCLFFSCVYTVVSPRLTSWGASRWSDWQWIKIKNTSSH